MKIFSKKREKKVSRRKEEARQRRIRRKQNRAKQKENALFLLEILAVVLLALGLVFFFGQKRTNIGQSMEPTLYGGDQVLLDTATLQFMDPQRNDLIAFRSKGSAGSQCSIKRVIGLPGETIQIVDGQIFINQTVYVESVDYPKMNVAGLAEREIKLGNDEYFVLGDNRNNSEDSRFTDVGTVAKSEIEGKVWAVISPKEHAAILAFSSPKAMEEEKELNDEDLIEENDK